MNMPTMLKLFLSALIVSMLALTTLVIYFDFLERPFLYYLHIPFPMVQKRVVAGTAAYIEVTRCNRDSYTRSYVISHMLVNLDNGKSYVLPSATTSIAPGCETVQSAFNVVPMDAVPGNYFVRGVSEAQGTLRTNLVVWESEPFKVVKYERIVP